MPPRVLLVTPTTGYQMRQFLDAARRLQWEITIASDRCHQLDDPWADQATPIRFEDPKEAVARVSGEHFDGILACGDRAANLAAQIAEALGIAFHPSAATALCHDKFLFKQRLAEAGLPVPAHRKLALDCDLDVAARETEYPCVLKPLVLSGSRGVIRADDAAQFRSAFDRIRRLLRSKDILSLCEPDSDWILCEEYIPGREYALEGWATEELTSFALFDKPDPLEGPYFEETIYVTPSRLAAGEQRMIHETVQAVVRAVGLGPGPIHAEIRLHEGRPYVLEIAARPIGGLCARALRFISQKDGTVAGLEELLLRAAAGDPVTDWEREDAASGVMMIPIPGSGILENVDGVENAQAVQGIESVEITAKIGEPLTALPEGASYLGFIFAGGSSPAEVEESLRTAHARLNVELRSALPTI